MSVFDSIAKAATGGVGKVLVDAASRIFPDPQKAAEFRLDVMKLDQAGEFKEMDDALARENLIAASAIAQIEVVKIEAASGDKYTSRMRPTAGYGLLCMSFWLVALQPILHGLSASIPLPDPTTVERVLSVTALFYGLYIPGRSIEKGIRTLKTKAQAQAT